MATKQKSTKASKPATLENAFGMAQPKAEKPAPKAKAEKPAAAEKPVQVALRGGVVAASVKLTGKAYRTGAKHNADWWATITSACAGDKPATVAALVDAKVPTHFIGYTLRRGYLQQA